MLEELAPGVYISRDYWHGNVGLIASARGALLVDMPMRPWEAEDWCRRLQGEGVGPIFGVVNTDYHPEHMFGNAAVMPTRILGHDASLKPIEKYRTSGLDRLVEEIGEDDPALAAALAEVELFEPEIGVDDRVTLHLGDRRVKVIHMEGHTPASLVVYLPEERLLFAGDNLMNQEHPALYDANTEAWLRTLRRIRSMDVDVIVPGEGAPCGKEVIDPLIEYITEMRRRTAECFATGASRRDCVEKVGMLDFFPVPEEKATRIRERRRHSVERVYTEIRLAQRDDG